MTLIILLIAFAFVGIVSLALSIMFRYNGYINAAIGLGVTALLFMLGSIVCILCIW